MAADDDGAVPFAGEGADQVRKPGMLDRLLGNVAAVLFEERREFGLPGRRTRRKRLRDATG
jgi:hypothetical protein